MPSKNESIWLKTEILKLRFGKILQMRLFTEKLFQAFCIDKSYIFQRNLKLTLKPRLVRGIVPCNGMTIPIE
jgi:hypothetical protein